MRNLKWLGCLAVLIAGCVDSGLETRSSELAVEGPWAPPQELVDQADAYDIPNVQAGAWVGSSGCSPSFTEGGATFRQWLYDNWPQVEHVGGYACRAIANSSSMSVHATGRAVDIHIPLDGGAADNDLGDPLANWLLEHAEEIGVQSIIWDRWIWSTSRPAGQRSRAYGGTHPHHDHLHVELTPAAARLETPWFQGPMGPPDVSGCDEPLPTEGGVIDDSNSCFQAFGPAQYWRREEAGIEGGLRWTNAFETDDPSNWARWRINLAEGGTYRVEFNKVSEWAVFGSTHYAVKHGQQTEDFIVDQSAGEDGWIALGEWEFAAGADQWIAVYDDFDGPVPDDQHVLADAIRLVRPSVDDATDDVIVPGPDPTDTPPVDEGVLDQPANEEASPMLIHGEGGCGCATAGRAADSGLLALLLLGFLRRRR